MFYFSLTTFLDKHSLLPANWAFFRASKHTGYISSKWPLLFLLVDSTCREVGTYLVVSEEVAVSSQVWTVGRIFPDSGFFCISVSRVLQRLAPAWTDLKGKLPLLGKVGCVRGTLYCLLFPSVSQIFLSLTTKQKFVVYSFVFGFVSHLFFFEVKHSLVIEKVTLAQLIRWLQHLKLWIRLLRNNLQCQQCICGVFCAESNVSSGVKGKQTVMNWTKDLLFQRWWLSSPNMFHVTE